MREEKSYCVYILANKPNGVLYIGVTNDLIRRILEHKEGKVPGFTKKYDCKTLVWFDTTNDVGAAIMKEKQIKKWKRDWKIRLIEEKNPAWRDLYEDILPS